MKHATLRQLRIFEALARCLSFSRAAEELHLTQPAVSMQVKLLEQEIGLALTEQVGKKIQLTEAGEEIAQLARDVAQRMRESEEALAAMKGVRGGRLTVAIVSSAKYSAPRLLGTFLQRHPGVTLKLEVNNRETVLEQLQANDIDLAITGRLPEGLAAFAKPFAENPHIVIAHPDHPLAKAKRIALTRLVREPIINREVGSGTRLAFERLLAKHGLANKPAMEMSSNESIKQAVLARMGISFLSRQTVTLELATGRLVELDVEGTPVMRRWYLVHREDKRLSPVAQAFKSFLQEEGEALMREQETPRAGRVSPRGKMHRKSERSGGHR